MTPKAAPASTASTKPVPKSAAAPVKAAAKPQIKPQAKRQQLAALTPSGDSLLQVRFRAGSSALTRGDEDLLKTMADKVAATEARLQLKAYAEGSGNDTSKARRLSLSRALAVRSFLIENGLRSTRIDVRALGIARDGGAPDRVDILLLQR
jgi:outer membrane protein OmpA-like peptidoglycan-associated protein